MSCESRRISKSPKRWPWANSGLWSCHSTKGCRPLTRDPPEHEGHAHTCAATVLNQFMGTHMTLITACALCLRRIREELRLQGRFRHIRLFVPHDTFTSMAALEEQLLKNIPYPLKQLPRNAYTVCMRPEEGEEKGVEIKTNEELKAAYTQVQESRESGVGKLRLVLEDTHMLDDYLSQRRYARFMYAYIHAYIFISTQYIICLLMCSTMIFHRACVLHALVPPHVLRSYLG